MDGNILDESPRKLYKVSLLSLPLGQQGHHSKVQQEALGIMSSNIHPQHKDKSFFEHYGNALKKMKLDSTGAFKEMNQKLLVFARYVHSGSFCSPLETTTKASDILEKVSSFIESENLLWDNVCGCCTDGAPAMLGTNSGFQVFVKMQTPKVKGIHCMIYHQALASKTLPAPLEKVLDQTIQIVNFGKGGALNLQLFSQLYTDMDAGHCHPLFHTNVQCLSRGNVTEQVFELRDELKLFFELQGKMEFFAWLEWIMHLACLVDIEQLNKLNLQIQGRNKNIIKFMESLKAFMSKLENWKRKHLTALENEFRYLPELSEEELNLVQNPFKLLVEKVLNDCQDEFLELKTYLGARAIFNEKSIAEFWPLMCNSNPKVAAKAIHALLPFVSIHLCKSDFNSLTNGN
ncbi:zinc finger BED domain-containing protein 5-like [Tachypleus tridentatus]|uniref:zinc finger BED domain-containing protein 5-like n=1 Tax=Tachypleus tridentatus TaxID=6853 RepID=UPI003FCFE102